VERDNHALVSFVRDDLGTLTVLSDDGSLVVGWCGTRVGRAARARRVPD
jgi:hypothetical protein